MMNMYSTEIVTKILGNPRIYGGVDRNVETLYVDSRLVVEAERGLFFAITGVNHNGHDYVEQLYALGCRSFVVEEWRESFKSMAGATFWKVSSALEALQCVAAYHRENIGAMVVAVTGSNGKTIVKEWLYQTLRGVKYLFRSPRSYNSQVGVPLSVGAIPVNAEFAVIEAGISAPGSMERLERIIKPDLGIFTNIGDAHSENFASKEQKLREKLKLFKGCRKLYFRHGIIPNDIMGDELPGVVPVCWGEGAECNVVVISKAVVGGRREIEVKYGEGIFTFSIPFIDEASFENIMNVVTFMIDMGVAPDYIVKSVADIQPVATRMEIKEGINSSILIQDYYNSDPESFRLALERLAQQDKSKRRVVILSDFVDIANDTIELYKSINMQMQSVGVTLFIGVGENLATYRDLFDISECRFYRRSEEFMKLENFDLFSNMAILLKGARKFRFEYIAARLQKQGHMTLLEVDLDAMMRNLNHFKTLVPPETKFAVMVKAFTYGCGGAEIASMLQYQGVDYLMVAFADEGIELRAAGITAHIAVMNPEIENFDKMIEFGLEPEIFSMELLQEFERALLRHGVQRYPIHLKLNTGMNRSGFDENEIDELLSFFDSGRNVIVSSVFTHLAGADEACHDTFTLKQIERFERMSSRICARFSHKVLRHVLNSAGIERFPQYHYDMVRLGIGIHGVSACGAVLEPVATFKTHISAIREVKSSETVGYGRKGELKRDSRIAVILVGYADGLDRHLSRGVGEVYVRGHRVPIVGNICMDASMLDITDFPDIEVGDEVEIFGRHISITGIADKLGTIPYEIITGISRRVRRLFFKE